MNGRLFILALSLLVLPVLTACESVNLPIAGHVYSSLSTVPDGMLDGFGRAAASCGYTDIYLVSRESGDYIFYANARVKIEQGFVTFGISKTKSRNAIGLVYSESDRWQSEGYREDAKKYIYCAIRYFDERYPGVFYFDVLP